VHFNDGANKPQRINNTIENFPQLFYFHHIIITALFYIVITDTSPFFWQKTFFITVTRSLFYNNDSTEALKDQSNESY